LDYLKKQQPALPKLSAALLRPGKRQRQSAAK
jgi:hypothetical protein